MPRADDFKRPEKGRYKGIFGGRTSRSPGPERLPGVSLKPFEEIVVQHGPAILRVCRAVAGPADADDVWSETFLAALGAYPRLREDSNVEAWLVTIAHREAIDQRRAAARRPLAIDPLPEPAPRAREDSGWEIGLWQALETLPLKQRQTVAYHHLAGLSYRDIAKIVGGTEAAARRAAADGVAALRKALGTLASSPRGARPPSRASAPGKRAQKGAAR